MRKSDLVLSVFAVLIVSGLFAKGVQLLVSGNASNSCLKTSVK